MSERTHGDIQDAIDDVRANMPWSDDRDDLLDDLYQELSRAPLACSHKHCGEPVDKAYAMWKLGLPYHVYCFYAHPEYDVKKGEGSPFTTFTRILG